jgi:hypothetical protein
MTTQNEIFEKMRNLIPADLWKKYNHLSFGEMAEIEELEDYADALRQAEDDWFEAEDA